MAANLGTYLGLVGAAAIVWVGNRYLNNRVIREAKIYNERQISVAKERKPKPDARTDVSPDNREQQVESEGNDAGRDRVQDTTSTEPEPNESESGKGSKRRGKKKRINVRRGL